MYVPPLYLAFMLLSILVIVLASEQGSSECQQVEQI